MKKNNKKKRKYPAKSTNRLPEGGIRSWFALQKKPYRGLWGYEWIMIGYLILTLIMIGLLHSRLPNAQAMIGGRLRILAITLAIWGVYCMLPCRIIGVVRATIQLALLGWWYPDTYELNRVLPNLDHLFATAEQAVFGCQPALLFSQYCSNGVFSELMCLGYSCYYPMIAVVTLFYVLFRNKELEWMLLILMGVFFIHYAIFILLPVTGPQFYFCAVGEDNIAAGVFPNLYDYFNLHQECLPCPGYKDGFFYYLVEVAHESGERPTAAFPSSHVSICFTLLLLAWRTRCRLLFYTLLPFAVLLFFSTVYIKAHYAIDAIAGLISGAMIYALLVCLTKKRTR